MGGSRAQTSSNSSLGQPAHSAVTARGGVQGSRAGVHLPGARSGTQRPCEGCVWLQGVTRGHLGALERVVPPCQGCCSVWAPRLLLLGHAAMDVYRPVQQVCVCDMLLLLPCVWRQVTCCCGHLLACPAHPVCHPTVEGASCSPSRCSSPCLWCVSAAAAMRGAWQQ